MLALYRGLNRVLLLRSTVVCGVVTGKVTDIGLLRSPLSGVR